MMQLDDVVKTTTVGPRVEEAMERTIRWVDRCIEAHARDDDQSLFPLSREDWMCPCDNVASLP